MGRRRDEAQLAVDALQSLANKQRPTRKVDISPPQTE